MRRNAELEKTKTILAARIRAAFQYVERGAGVSLHEADVIDGYGTAQQRKRARLLDTEQTWDTVPADKIRKFHWCLPFLDPLGYRFYVPAYMLFAVNEPHSDSADNLLYSLAAGKGDLRKWARERFEIFSEAQKCAICRFLRYWVALSISTDADTSAREALKYWAPFCRRNLRAE